MTQLLNTTDYSTTILVLAFIGSVFWILSYLLLVKDAIKFKYVEMPIIAFCGNIAWEFLYSFVFVDHINLGKLYTWGYQAWFFIDIAIMVFIFMYGRKQVVSSFFKKYFFFIVPAVMLFYGFLLYFWINLGFDNTPFDAPHEAGRHISKVALGATSAYFLNLVISLLYLRELYTKVPGKHLSFWNGVFRWLGTGLFTIMFHLIDPGNYIVTTLGVFIFLSDSVYVFTLLKSKINPPVKLSDSVVLENNIIFDSIWEINKDVEKYENFELKVIKKSEWNYESGDFKCEYKVYEGGLIYQKAIGRMTDKAAEIVIPMINEIAVEIGIYESGYYFMTDSLEVKMAEPAARQKSMDFFTDNDKLKETIVVVSPMVNTMIKLAPIKKITNNFLITNSLEKAFTIYLNCNSTKSKNIERTRYQTQNKGDNSKILELIQAISLNKFDKVENITIEPGDANYDLQNPIKLLSSDREALIKEKNAIQSEIKIELENRIDQFSALFSYSGFYSIIFDSKLNILDFNKKAEETFKMFGQDLVIGYNISNFISDEQLTHFEERIESLKDHDIITYVHKEEVVVDGIECWFETTIFQIEQNGDTLIGAISNEITERIKLSKEKSALVNNLKNKNEYLNSIHHTISHELNHEIASINQITGLLDDPVVDIRKKMELLEELSVISGKLDSIRAKMNSSLHGDNSDKKDEIIEPHLASETTISLVDDDPITNTVNKLTIKSFNKEIKTKVYKNPMDAVEDITTSPEEHDIVFLDINMPEMSGWEVLDKIDHIAFENNINVYMLTSSENDEEKKQSESYSSVKGFVSKPLNANFLSTIIKD